MKLNEYVAMALAVGLLSTNIDGAKGLELFGYHLPTIGYANTFIPILLGVWFLSVVTKYLKKIIPSGLQYFLVPALSLVLTFPVILVVFGPIGTLIGDGVSAFFDVLMNTIGNWIVVVLYAAFQPFLIVLGAANFTYPIVLNFLGTIGYDPIIMHAATISDVAVCGAMFGYFLRAKKGHQRQMFGTVSFSALMGITEPAVFGVFVKYRRPFLAVIIGGGLGGLIAGLAGVKTMGFVWGLASLPTYLAGGTSNFIWMIISVVVGFVGATAVAYGIGIPKEESEEELEEKELVEALESNQGLKQVCIGKIAEGTAIPLCEVSDRAFASGALGKGVGILPNQAEESIISPVEGTVTVAFPTKHAYGIKTKNGVELLIHIGVDTVNLKGKYFESFVEKGQEVKKGDILAKYQADKVKEAGFDPVIIVVVTNSNDYLDVISTSNEQDDELLTVIL